MPFKTKVHFLVLEWGVVKMTTDVEIDQKQEKGVEWLMAACVRGVLVTLGSGVGVQVVLLLTALIDF